MYTCSAPDWHTNRPLNGPVGGKAETANLDGSMGR